MNQIVPNLYGLSGMLMGRVYLIKDDDGLTLIDTAVGPAARRIVKAIEGAGYQPHDLKRILITHAHPDHVGGLHGVVQATGAEVWASEQETEVIEGRIAVPGVPREELSGPLKLFKPPQTYIKPPVKVSRVIRDGEVLPVFDGLTVVATPGHAPGHVSFWHPGRKLVVTGDVVFHLLNRLTLPFAFFTVDMKTNKRSLRRLIELGPEIACFGHGRPIMSGAAAALRRLAERVGA